MSLSFSPTDAARLAAPHVARAWLAVLDLPAGTVYLHSGVGTVTVMGHDWLGVADPGNAARLVAVDQIKEPRFGAAAAVTFTLAGVTAEFMRSIRLTNVEGRAAEVYWAAFDPEDGQVIGSPVLLFPRGRMTAPSRKRQGIGTRIVSLTVENVWSGLNYAPGGRWNQADQRRRYPGDKGLDFVGVTVVETPQ